MSGIRIRGLEKRFGAVVAVAGLDLDVAPGEVLGFLGPNGAGKTTTLRVLAGLLAPTAGSIDIGGAPAGSPAANARMGLCPQEDTVYPELTARENVMHAGMLYKMTRAARRDRADGLLERLGLDGKADAQARELSGGQRRRLTLAMALVHDPQVVVLDEPGAGLDPQSRVAVRDFVRELAGDHTVVLTSHDMDEVDRVADRVAVIDHGKIIADGTPRELKQAHGHGQAIEVDCQEPGKAQEALAAAGFGTDGTRLDATERRVVVHGEALGRRFADVVDALEARGVVTDDVRYRDTSLEDVFIALTGRGLRE